MALQKKKGWKTIPANEQGNEKPGWLTTFLNHQDETRLKQEESRERQHAEELQILRDLRTSRENNNQNDNRTQETTTKTQATPRPPLLEVTTNYSKFLT